MTNIEEIDAIILRELLKDGRKSFVTIAAECNTSKDIIWKHYSDMKKAGIIVGATTQYNYPLFGYEGVVFVLVNVESQQLDKVFERLVKSPNFNTFRQYNSAYNIGIIGKVKKLRDLDKIKELIKTENPLTAIRTYLWTDVRNIPENLSFGFAENKISQTNENEPKEEESVIKNKVKLDETDIRIVEELTKNGRMPFSRIGQLIGASTDTVARRYANLVKSGYIKVSIQINPILLGYKAIINFFIALLSQDTTENAVEKLSKIPNVSYIAKMSGDYDLHVAILVKDVDEILAVNEEIMKINGIAKVEADIRGMPSAWPGPRQYISTF